MRVKVGREYDSKDEGDDENKTAEYVAEESEGGSNANDDEERIDYTVELIVKDWLDPSESSDKDEEAPLTEMVYLVHCSL